MAKTTPAAAAKAQFSAALRDAESGEQVIITRYGKPVAVLVRPELMAQLERLQALDEGGGLSSVVGAVCRRRRLPAGAGAGGARCRGPAPPEFG